MKILIIPIGSAVLATALCVYGCHAFGMPQSDLFLAGLVSGSVSVSVAVSAALFAKSRREAR
jgi:hypothetical protein